MTQNAGSPAAIGNVQTLSIRWRSEVRLFLPIIFFAFRRLGEVLCEVTDSTFSEYRRIRIADAAGAPDLWRR